MLKNIIITGLLFLSFPAIASAQNYAPCAHIEDEVLRYQCRRKEALSHVRTLNMEFRRNSRPTILGIKEQYGKELKNIYRDYAKLSSSQRKVFTDELKDKKLASYLEWHHEERELLKARRNIRYLTRIPNNKELRLELIKEKGVFLDAKGNQKKSRRVIVEEQLNRIRSYRN